MGFKRQHIAIVAVGTASVWIAEPIAAAPAEPVITERLPDPDPNFVAPPPETKHASARADRDSTFEGAMEDLGRVIGQAALIEKQQVEARCKAGLPADASSEQRFALEAACRYQRH